MSPLADLLLLVSLRTHCGWPVSTSTRHSVPGKHRTVAQLETHSAAPFCSGQAGRQAAGGGGMVSFATG